MTGQTQCTCASRHIWTNPRPLQDNAYSSSLILLLLPQSFTKVRHMQRRSIDFCQTMEEKTSVPLTSEACNKPNASPTLPRPLYPSQRYRDTVLDVSTSSSFSGERYRHSGLCRRKMEREVPACRLCTESLLFRCSCADAPLCYHSQTIHIMTSFIQPQPYHTHTQDPIPRRIRHMRLANATSD